MPSWAWTFRMFSFRSRRMKETVSGVLAGVVPKTVAPGSEAALTSRRHRLLGVRARAGCGGRGRAGERGQRGHDRCHPQHDRSR